MVSAATVVGNRPFQWGIVLWEKILQGITISLGPAQIAGVVCNRENFVCVNKSTKEGKDQE